MSRCYRLLVVSLLYLGALPAQAEKFVTNLTFKTRKPDLATAKIVTGRLTKAALLNQAAELAALDPRTLELVYDTDTDSILVVRKSDGAVLLPELTFTGGLTLTNGTDTVRQRQTFVKYQGSPNITGSAVGRIDIARNPDLSLKKFLWTASVQINQPAGLFNPDLIITGIFTIGRRFTPTGQ